MKEVDLRSTCDEVALACSWTAVSNPDVIKPISCISQAHEIQCAVFWYNQDFSYLDIKGKKSKLALGTYNDSTFILNCLIFADRFDQGCWGKWIIKQKLEHTVIVLKCMFDASTALTTVTHPQLFHCVVP